MSRYARTLHRFLSLVPALLFLVTACGSNSTGPDDSDGFFMCFEANGTHVTYTDEATLVATFVQSGAQHSAVFTGYDATTNMALQVYSDAPVTTSTYSGYNLSGTVFVGALIGYDVRRRVL